MKSVTGRTSTMTVRELRIMLALLVAIFTSYGLVMTTLIRCEALLLLELSRARIHRHDGSVRANRRQTHKT